MQIELDDNLTTSAQLTLPLVGQGPYPGILLITGSGAEDMNETWNPKDDILQYKNIILKEMNC